MILAVDIGNTNVVLGSIEGNKVATLARLATDPGKTAYEYAVIIREILDFCKVDATGLEGSIITSVVPVVTATVKGALKLLSGKEPLVVTAGVKTGLNIRIDDPAQLGSDLVVGAVAAIALCPPPIIVIDMGTATTISVVGRGNAFLGGAIAPGPALSIKALAGGTSLLTNATVAAPKKCISTNTETCMQSGVVYGAAAMLDGMIERMEEELGEPASLIATGGLSGCVVPLCRRKIRFEPDLLLQGLAILWKKNL